MERLFAELARGYGMYVIAGMGYLPSDGAEVRSLALAFSPQGELLGEFARVSLLPSEEDGIAPGEGWTLLQMPPLGRVGVLMGGDVLYPETARLLAYHGAEVLVIMAATSDPALAAQIRATALARAQENQLFVLVSFLVGNDPLQSDRAQFTGRSAILAPMGLTQDHSGILVEMGTAAAEGLITAELDLPALRELWRTTKLSVRRGRPLTLAGQLLASDYTLGRSIDEAWEDVESQRDRTLLLPKPADTPAVPVHELPVIGVEEAIQEETAPAGPSERGQPEEEPPASEPNDATSPLGEKTPVNEGEKASSPTASEARGASTSLQERASAPETSAADESSRE